MTAPDPVGVHPGRPFLAPFFTKVKVPPNVSRGMVIIKFSGRKIFPQLSGRIEIFLTYSFMAVNCFGTTLLRA